MPLSGIALFILAALLIFMRRTNSAHPFEPINLKFESWD